MFDDRFEVFLADSTEARRLHYRLRYQIYCEERGFEPPEQFPSRHERDAADDTSSHFVVRAKASGEWVATMRLVLPSGRPFPIQDTCTLGDGCAATVPWGRSGEISRLGIIRRRPSGREVVRADDLNEAPAVRGANIPEIMFGLFRATYNHCRERGLDHCLWMSAPGLVRMLKRYQLPMQPLGDPCFHRGVRQPFIIDVEPFWAAVGRATRRLDPAFHRGHGYLPFSALAAESIGPRRPRAIDVTPAPTLASATA